MLTILIIVISIAIYFICYVVLTNKKLSNIKKLVGDNYLPDVYYIEIDKNGPTIVIVSGTHGNEPAPGYYFQRFVESEEYSLLPPAKYYIVPFVNISGIRTYERNTFYQPDINRSWPTSDNNKPSNDINKYLLPIINSADYIFDFHEGWGNMYKDKGRSVGHSIYCNKINYKSNIDNIISDINNDNSDIDSVNNNIWSFNPENIELKGSLREYAEIKNILYVLVEVKGQDDVAPVSERIKYTEFIFKKLLKIIR